MQAALAMGKCMWEVVIDYGVKMSDKSQNFANIKPKHWQNYFCPVES